MAFDIAPWLAEKPFEIEAWCDALGIGSLVSSTIMQTIETLAPTLTKFSPGALQAWRDQQELLLATAQWVRAGTDKRAAVAIARGAETPFGKALAQTGMLCDAKIRCLIADNAKHFPPTQQE